MQEKNPSSRDTVKFREQRGFVTQYLVKQFCMRPQTSLLKTLMSFLAYLIKKRAVKEQHGLTWSVHHGKGFYGKKITFSLHHAKKKFKS